jgi:hypothetical protein
MAFERRALRYILGLSSAVLLSSPSTSRAEVDPVTREIARTYMAKGKAQRKQNDLKGALEQFRSAHQIMHVPTTGFEVARTQAMLGMLVEALDTLAQIAQIPQAPNENEAFRTARSAAGDLDKELKDRAPSAIFSFVGLGPGVTPKVSVDSVPVPASSFGTSYRLNPGQHTISVKTDDAEDKRLLTFGEGEAKRIEFDLSRGRDAAARGLGQPARADVAMNDVDVIPARSTPHGVYVLAGVAGLGVGTGVVLVLLGNRRKSDLESTCSPYCSDESVDKARRLYTAANISFGIGAASAIASVVWAIAAPTGSAHMRADSGSPFAPRFVSIDVHAVPSGAFLGLKGTLE